MKRLTPILPLLAVLLFAGAPASAQEHWQERIFMEYYVETPGDTVYVDTLPPAVVFPRIRNTKDPDVKKYYRLVYNFSKVYPYTGVAVRIVRKADRDLAAMRRRRDKEKYVNAVSDQLLDDFSSVARHMTVSQGKLLVRLVDREVGKTPYSIVKEYKSGAAASFWQGVAKIFGQDLKTHYDPKGEDRMTEYLIEKWNQGQFEALYFSIFMEWPDAVEIPSKYR
ncbi:MAG: DUF4294 domain-containing protein [Bacteroidales bacterium]|nr:DUF4294 domain-containing protein [Bacteroidales bacterium]